VAFRRYFRAYRRRAPQKYLCYQLSRWFHRGFAESGRQHDWSFAPFDSPAYRLVKCGYRAVKKAVTQVKSPIRSKACGSISGGTAWVSAQVTTLRHALIGPCLSRKEGNH
jgi:hypothetical protein